MSELGEKLKSARLEKGWSLDELQKRTKIQKRYLEAIEEGDFSSMPGDFYARAFVKTYAETVHLNTAEIFAAYEEELPKLEKTEAADLPRRADRTRAAGRSRPNSSSSLLPTLFGIGFILIVGLAVWFFIQDNNQPERTAVNNDQQENGVEVNNIPADENGNEPSGDTAPDENNNNESDSLDFSEQEDNRFYYTFDGSEEWELELNFTGNSWVQILDENDSEIHQQEHGDGDEISFDLNDDDAVTFNLGNARTARIFINGEELEYVNDQTRKYVIIERVSP